MTTRALVTGGNGFVAQWAMRAMLQRDWHVTAAGIGDRPAAPVLTDEERGRIDWQPMDITSQYVIGPSWAVRVSHSRPITR